LILLLLLLLFILLCPQFHFLIEENENSFKFYF
jgi:hypothetical protein